MISRSILAKIYKPREKWSHKGNFGKLLVVGGSIEYSGSPAFNAIAAYRSGVDLVHVVAPEETTEIIGGFMPDMIVNRLEGDYLSIGHVKEILEMQKKFDAMVIGGGLSRRKETFAAVNRILSKTRIPCVIDADAIHAVAKNKKILKKNFVLTPHAHEFFILSGTKPRNDIDDRKGIVRKLASDLSCTVLLKGHVDVISDGKLTEENKTGNPFMTKGGFGDTLAGICGALLARASAFDAACAAAYINGAAGDLAAKKFGEGVMASDLLDKIPDVIKSHK